MRPVRVTVTGTGVSPVIAVDIRQAPVNAGLGVSSVGGAATWTVEYTFEDIWRAGWDPAVAKWFAHPTMTAKTTDFESNLAFPCTGIRLNVASAGGSVVTTFVYTQATHVESA